MRHIVFDFDGTLVDSRQIGLDIYNDVASRRGLRPMTDTDLDFLRQLPLMERFRIMKMPLHRLPALVVEFTRLYGTALDRLTFFEGIPAILDDLRERGYGLHILSSNSEANIRTFLSAQGITTIETVTSSRNVFGKHRSLAKFLRLHGLRPGEILYVGDEERDVIACHKADVRVAAVTWGFDAADVLQSAGADHLVDRPQDLVPLIESLAAR